MLYFTDIFSKFCWNFKGYLLIPWGRHVCLSSTDSKCLPVDSPATSPAFKKRQVPWLIASAGPASLLSAALSHWRRRHFRKSENSGLHLSGGQRPYSFLSLFPVTRRSVFSPRITTTLLLLSVLQLSLDDVFFSCWTSHTRTKLHSHHRISPSPIMFYRWRPWLCWP